VRYAFVVPLVTALLVAVGFVNARRPIAPAGDYCYLHGDHDHRLTWVSLDDRDPRTNETTIGLSRATKVDAIALQPSTGTLFGADSLIAENRTYLGTFNLATGALQRKPEPIGTGFGVLGELDFHDISGLTFDPETGWLYAVQIKTGEGVPDALLRVDPNSGRFVPRAFGEADYVPLYPVPEYPFLWDMDDIAIDPDTGQMYGIFNNSKDGDRLVKIDKSTGATRDVGPFGLGEVEGLAFDPHGQLWATAGGAPTGDPANALYAVDKATGVVTDRRPLDNSGNYEALACETAAPGPRGGR
jgi:hypothetical protein